MTYLGIMEPERALGYVKRGVMTYGEFGEYCQELGVIAQQMFAAWMDDDLTNEEFEKLLVDEYKRVIA